MYVTVKNLSNVFTLDINYWDIIIMDYSGKGKGKEAESTGGLRWLSAPRPLAARTPAPSRLPRAGAPSAAMVAGRAAGHGKAGGARRPLEGCALS